MDTLRVDICYRPLRLGWAIRRGDFDSLREVFRFSHTLWGGRFNPVIVVDEADRARRLVELFRVDVVWPFGDAADLTTFPDRFPHLINPFLFKSLTVGSEREDKRAQLLDIQNTLVSMDALGEIGAIRERGFKLYSWEAGDPLADLFLIQLGTYPDAAEIGIDYQDILTQALQPEAVALLPDSAFPAEFLEHPGISSLPTHRMRRHYTTPAGSDYPGFYVGDVTDFDDLVTYWNLRAADVSLSFVDPNHLERFSDLIPAWEKFAQQLLARAPEHRKGLAVWARGHDDQAALQPFGGRLNIFRPIHEHAWGVGATSAPMMYFGETQVLGTASRSDGQPRVSFPLADKPFADDRWFHTQHLVASVSFGIGLYDDEQFTVSPPYVPELNEFLATTMHFNYSKLRVEPERLGLIIDAVDIDASVSALTVTELFERVFELAGFSAKPSNAGLIARQLITRLGGLQGARVFKIPGVRKLLRTHGPTASFTKKSALQLIGQTDPENPSARFADHERLFIELLFARNWNLQGAIARNTNGAVGQRVTMQPPFRNCMLQHQAEHANHDCYGLPGVFLDFLVYELLHLVRRQLRELYSAECRDDMDSDSVLVVLLCVAGHAITDFVTPVTIA